MRAGVDGRDEPDHDVEDRRKLPRRVMLGLVPSIHGQPDEPRAVID